MPKVVDQSIDKTIKLLLEGLTVTEVATQQDLKVGTVKKRRKSYNQKVDDGKLEGPKVIARKRGRQRKAPEDGLPDDVKVLKERGEKGETEPITVQAEVMPPDDDPGGANAQTIPEGSNVVAFVKPSRKEREGKDIKEPDKVVPEAIQYVTELLETAAQVPLPSIEQLKQVNWYLSANARDADSQYRYMALYIRLIQTEATLPENMTDPWKDWTTEDRDQAMASIIEKYRTDEERAG